MLKKLTIEDVAVLREPLVSGRQSPKALGGAIFWGVFMQILVYYLEYTVLGRVTNFPYKEQILTVHFWVTLVLVILSVIYAIPFIYIRSQKTQYLVSILVSQNIAAVFLYISGLFLLGKNQEISEKSLQTFTMVTLSLGVLLYCYCHPIFYFIGEREVSQGFDTRWTSSEIRNENVYSNRHYWKYCSFVYHSICRENFQLSRYRRECHNSFMLCCILYDDFCVAGAARYLVLQVPLQKL